MTSPWGQKRTLSLLCQPSTGASPQRPEQVPQHDEAACRHPSQDDGSRFSLWAESPHRPSRTTPPSPLHASRHVVYVAFRSDLQLLLHIPSILFDMLGTACSLTRGDVSGHPLERRLNWIPNPTPSPPRDHGKENHPPKSQPPKLPRKVRPRRRKERHHHQQQQHHAGNAPGTERMRTLVKHPQLPQHPQHPRPAANENSSWANLLGQADPSRLYKQATPSRGKESTDRSR